VIVSNIVYKQLNDKIMDPFKVKDPRPGIASASTAKKMSKTPAAAAKKERKTGDVRKKVAQKNTRKYLRDNFTKKKPRKKDMIKGG